MNFNEMVYLLFTALDDTVIKQYHTWKRTGYDDDYPSETAIRALEVYQNKGFGESKALREMRNN